MPRARKSNPEGLPPGLYKHGKRYRMSVEVDGKRAWRDLGEDKADALRQWAEITGRPTDTLNAVFDRYEREVMPTKAPKTRKEQTRQLQRLRQVFGNMHPTALKTQHAIQYIDARASVAGNREIALMRHVLTKCRHWGVLEANPFIQLQYRHKEQPREREVTDAEFLAALRCPHKLTRRLVWLSYLTGLRRGDLLSLNRFQIKDEGLDVGREHKTGKRVIVAWTPSLRRVVDHLARDSKPDPRLFPVTQSAMDTAWQRFMRKLPKEQRWQVRDLRAKHASDFEDRGGDATKQLGHSDRRVTVRHYLRKARTVTPLR